MSHLFLAIVAAVSVFAQVSPTTAKLRAYESYKGRRSSWLRSIWPSSGGRPTILAVRPCITAWCTMARISQTAKNPIRLGPRPSIRNFPSTDGHLKPRTTYYYTVDSMEATGAGDEVKSTVKRFTTPQ
jgi:hypothetical protein